LNIIDKQNSCIQSYKMGKVQAAHSLATEIIEELFLYKRIPTILSFLTELKNLGYPIKKIKIYENKLNQLKGGANDELNGLDWHIDHFKTSKFFLRNYLLEIEEWKKSEVQLCYEYILRFGLDPEITKKIEEIKSSIGIQETIEKIEAPEVSKLKLNYEDLAYDLISGARSIEDLEQIKIIESLKEKDFENLKDQGREMATAFRFLGMDEVVLYVCNKILPFSFETKERISLLFLIAESYMNLKRFLEAKEVIEKALRSEPVYGDEKLALEYLRAETYFLLGKKAESLKYFQEISRKTPTYRLVKQRLKSFEIN